MGTNGVVMQYFEWHLEDTGTLWQQLKEDADHLKQVGITAVWIPPCYKGTGTNDAGYGAYDLYDLGEFDQKGSIRTKYGTKDELLAAIRALQERGIRVYADVVLNHKAGADETQRFMAVEVDPEDRKRTLTDPYQIEGWTKFIFPGRKGVHSDFQWSWEHFNGTDFNQENGKSAIYLILGDDKEWAQGVAYEFGNYDYLMFSNVDFRHPAVREETKKWISWFIRETGVDGIRLDAIKHINDWFIRDLLEYVWQEFGKDFYCMGEYWEQDLEKVKEYLKQVEWKSDLFDVGLNYRLFEAAQKGRDFDMRSIFDRTLVRDSPDQAVTFVDNHDSQPGQPLESFAAAWFKPLAYGLILLRQGGYPCVFYGDYYGISGANPIPPIPELLDKLLYLRKDHAYGDQTDYFDHHNVVGWVRAGNDEHPDGCAVILSNGDDGWKEMHVGKAHSGETWKDWMENCDQTVTIDEEGNGTFRVRGGAISVYVRQDAG